MDKLWFCADLVLSKVGAEGSETILPGSSGRHEGLGAMENTAGQKVLMFPYQGGGNPRVEAQQAHVRFHAAVDHQMVLPAGLPYQLAVD